MKKLAVLLAAVAGLSGCVAYDEPGRYGGERRMEREREARPDRDRDRDGVPNRQDRRPDDPRRY